MLKQTTSIVDRSRSIYEDQWVVSLVAKPQGRNPEHSILLIEGIVADKCIFRRYDYVVGEPVEPKAGAANLVNLIKRKKGLVVIKEKECDFSDPLDERKQFFWAMIMKDQSMDEGCEGLSWALTDAQAEALHQAAIESQNNPPDYQISGNHSFFASSSSQTGHNCYTWARKLLIDLNHPDIKNDARMKTSLGDLLAARTTSHIAPEEKQSSANRKGLFRLLS